jgi:hypothetical protein
VLSIIDRSEKSIGPKGLPFASAVYLLTGPSPGRSSGWTTAKFFLDTTGAWAALPEPICPHTLVRRSTREKPE